jgi:hypothetical protein
MKFVEIECVDQLRATPVANRLDRRHLCLHAEASEGVKDYDSITFGHIVGATSQV